MTEDIVGVSYWGKAIVVWSEQTNFGRVQNTVNNKIIIIIDEWYFFIVNSLWKISGSDLCTFIKELKHNFVPGTNFKQLTFLLRN